MLKRVIFGNIRTIFFTVCTAISRYNNNQRSFTRKKERYPRNGQIKQKKVRVITDDEDNIGVIDTSKAMEMAREKGLDLVLLSPNQEIPVAKFLDYSKFKYEQSKKHKNKKGTQNKTKEWWFKPKIHDHDIKVKLNQVEAHLKKGGTAKATVKYMRRASYFDMNSTMDSVLELSSEFAEPMAEVTKEGRNLSVLLKYKKNEK